jgi:hypothetical protein
MRREARGVIAYKFLSAGAIGPFSGFTWPTPSGSAPGAWVEARSGVGVHACRPSDLPYWIDEELWITELSDDARVTYHQLEASRGRLLAPAVGWQEFSRAFAVDCAATLRGRVEAALAAGGLPAETAVLLRGYADDAEAWARDGNVAAAAFAAARASAVITGDPAAHDAERRRQAASIEQGLGLDRVAIALDAR